MYPPFLNCSLPSEAPASLDPRSRKILSNASAQNRATYDQLWAGHGDFTLHNPGARHRRRWILDLLARRPFASLLDVGCGNALLLEMIDARFPGKRLAGVDLSDVALSLNRRRLPHMEFFAADLAKDSLSSGFDVVVCSEVIEHLDDPRGAIAKLALACAPGGRVVVTCPTGRLYPTERYFGHVYHPRPDEVTAWAADAGLALEELVRWGFPVYSLTKWATNLNPEAALATFGMDKRYGPVQRLVSSALFIANFANLPSSDRAVQLFAVFSKPA